MFPRIGNLQAYLQTTGTEDDFYLGGAFDRQMRRYGRAYEHHFDPRGRGFSKVQMLGVCPVGDVKCRPAHNSDMNS